MKGGQSELGQSRAYWQRRYGACQKSDRNQIPNLVWPGFGCGFGLLDIIIVLHIWCIHVHTKSRAYWQPTYFTWYLSEMGPQWNSSSCLSCCCCASCESTVHKFPMSKELPGSRTLFKTLDIVDEWTYFWHCGAVVLLSSICWKTSGSFQKLGSNTFYFCKLRCSFTVQCSGVQWGTVHYSGWWMTSCSF